MKMETVSYLNVGGSDYELTDLKARQEIESLASGSPIGTFADLATLQAAENTDKTRIYLTLDNGHWNYWNGSAWASGGVYLSSLPDKTLTISGQAADAKAVRDYLSKYSDHLAINSINTSFEYNAETGDFSIVKTTGAFIFTPINFLEPGKLDNLTVNNQLKGTTVKFFIRNKKTLMCEDINTELELDDVIIAIIFVYSTGGYEYIYDCRKNNQNTIYDNDGISDIPLPTIIDTMVNREFCIYYDTLSRFENAENLYRFSGDSSLRRNEYCLHYKPISSASDIQLYCVRLNRSTAEAQETKEITLKANKLLTGNRVSKNICICGDSLVDNNYLAKEVYRMLSEDNDIDYKMIGTRGIDDGKHEGRGSWTWETYLRGDDFAGKTNAFWDNETGTLNFQKYCYNNGFSGIDYFLIELGTNDISQGTTVYNTLESVEPFIARAKQFIDILLSEDKGYPNCKVGIGLISPGAFYFYNTQANSYIFRKSANTLNIAYLKAFDAGKYHRNVTCFSWGSMTNSKYSFPYIEEAISERFSEKCLVLTNNVHPTERGYQAWADGFYNKIRGFLSDENTL